MKSIIARTERLDVTYIRKTGPIKFLNSDKKIPEFFSPTSMINGTNIARNIKSTRKRKGFRGSVIGSDSQYISDGDNSKRIVRHININDWRMIIP